MQIEEYEKMKKEYIAKKKIKNGKLNPKQKEELKKEFTLKKEGVPVNFDIDVYETQKQ